MKDNRPKNLNLFTIRFPIPAIVSILHRISGIFLFLFIPFLLWGLYLSLATEESFASVVEFISIPWVKFFVWCFLSAFIYHFVAGVRHLLMDIHIGETLRGGRFASFVVLGLSLLFIILTGVWLW